MKVYNITHSQCNNGSELSIDCDEPNDIARDVFSTDNITPETKNMYSQSSVNSTISVLSFTFFTAFTKLLHATLASLVSVKYVQGGENLDGLRTADVLTPLAVAETPDNRPPSPELLEI